MKLPRHQETAERPANNFPGYQAGASLKRWRVNSMTISPSILPRLPSRGLIEAYALEIAEAVASKTSPVTKPGPH